MAQPVGNLRGLLSVDECVENTDSCDDIEERCDNTEGSYTCVECEDGFRADADGLFCNIPETCVGGSCFVFLGDEDVAWNAGTLTCQNALGSSYSLACPSSAAQNDAVAAVAGGTKSWIGFTDSETEGQFTCGVGGDAMTSTNWNGDVLPGGAYYAVQDCAFARADGEWSDATCSTLLPVVCMRDDPDYTFVAPTDLQETCVDGECFVFWDDVVEWEHGGLICENALGSGYSLACPSSAAQNDAVAEVAGGTKSWIGFTDSETEGQFTCGVGGDAMASPNWVGDVLPAGDFYDVQDCAFARADGEWSDATCSTLLPVVCMRTDDSNSPTTLTWTGQCTTSQVGASGSVTLTKTYRESDGRYDVVLDGELSIYSPTYGYVRHELPEGFLPDDTLRTSCETQISDACGDTSGRSNYGGYGVYVYADTNPSYSNGDLWFPEKFCNGLYTLVCHWVTAQPDPQSWGCGITVV